MLMAAGISGLGFGPSMYDISASQFDPAARAEVEKWERCGWWRAPWYCTALTGRLFDECREHESLVSACVSGHYRQPPSPAAPPVPRGGDAGPVYDPDAVDSIVDESARMNREQTSDFFGGISDNLPPAETRTRTNWIWYAAGAALLLVLIKR